MMAVISIGLAAMIVAATPGMAFYTWIQNLSADWSLWPKAVALSTGFILGYFIYGVSLCFVAPAVNFLIPLRLKPWRGIWYSTGTIPWLIHNALTYAVRYTFLELITPSPLAMMFYRMMGMKIGKGVLINTTNISDPGMITLEDGVTIGGSVNLFAHYGQKGYLIIAPVVIKKGANIGFRASVMGGATIDEDVNILPHQVVMPNEHVKSK